MGKRLGFLRMDDGTLPAFAWPGGYPMVYLDGQNNTLCPKCANISDHDPWPEYRPVAHFIHYEGSSCYCDQCGKEMESAYGDPDEEVDDG